jgi:hypothetical protein
LCALRVANANFAMLLGAVMAANAELQPILDKI